MDTREFVMKRLTQLTEDLLSFAAVVEQPRDIWQAGDDSTLEDRINDMKQAQLHLADAYATLQKFVSEVEAAIAPAKQAIADDKATFEAHEEYIRASAMAYFLATGDKRPADGITIAYREKLMYDKKAALAWCEENAPDCVRVKRELDVRAFEKIADRFNGAEPGHKPHVVLKLDFMK